MQKREKDLYWVYNGTSSFLFVNATNLYQFKAKDSEIKQNTLCLGNISNDFTLDNVKTSGLKGSVMVFSVDYNPIDTNYILDIHTYSMKET